MFDFEKLQMECRQMSASAQMTDLEKGVRIYNGAGSTFQMVFQSIGCQWQNKSYVYWTVHHCAS